VLKFAKVSCWVRGVKMNCALHLNQPRSSKRPTFDELIGINLLSIRSAQGISEEVLASVLQVPIEEVRNLETGRIRVAANRLFNLAHYFRVPVHSFFRLEGTRA
jgi:hypothetical protein